MNVGGYLRGPWWRYLPDGENTRRCFVIAWGNICKEPKEIFRNDTSATHFLIKTGRGAGRNEKHLACVAYGERMANIVARSLQKGDIVICAGTWNETVRKNRKGKMVPVYDAKIDIIIPMSLIHSLMEMASTPEIYQAVNRWKDGAADPWESDDDDFAF